MQTHQQFQLLFKLVIPNYHPQTLNYYSPNIVRYGTQQATQCNYIIQRVNKINTLLFLLSLFLM